MCGIAGFAGRTPIDTAVLTRMCDLMRHRGPDSAGYEERVGVQMGMRRLAIIDVAGGDQPVFNEDGTVAVVFNGEIYNYEDLRRRLRSLGHRFRSHGDSECIAHLYEEYGENCVTHLRGMFAIAIWNDQKRELLLARDRVGKKPLFYRPTPRGIWFASELKAFTADPAFQRRVDVVALEHYLTYQYVPAPWTIFQGVSKLPPGFRLTYSESGTRVSPYWQLSFADKNHISEAEATEEFKALLKEATRLRMISERPIGAFLSGGLDSSLVVAAMADVSSVPIRTFSIGFRNPDYDERSHARLVARHFATEHHELVVDMNVFDILPKLAWHYDEPFADSSAIPSLRLAEMTKAEVTVALNGDGGDEGFGGYDRHRANLVASKIRVPRLLGPSVLSVLDRLPRYGESRSLLGKGLRFLRPWLEEECPYLVWVTHFDRATKAELYTDGMRRRLGGIDAYDYLRSAFADSDGLNIVDRTLDVDTRTYLPGDLLVKMDVATMAHSLEARSPFLDHCLLEFAARLPPRLKIRRLGAHLVSKYLMRQAARGWLPGEILSRPKQGFGVPMAEWLRDGLGAFAWDLLTDRQTSERGYFRAESVRRLLERHKAGEDHSTRLWNLIVLEMWHRTHFDPTRPEPTGAQEWLQRLPSYRAGAAQAGVRA